MREYHTGSYWVTSTLLFHGLRQNFTVSLAARCSEEEKKDYLWLIPAGVCALLRGKGYNEED